MYSALLVHILRASIDAIEMYSDHNRSNERGPEMARARVEAKKAIRRLINMIEESNDT